MKLNRFMVIAGEASGDLLAAELVKALRESPVFRDQVFPPSFFGAGGPHLAAAGVEVPVPLAKHAVVGLAEVLRHYSRFKRLFDALLRLATQRHPDVIILVDFSGFNRRFARAVKNRVRSQNGTFRNWTPQIVYFVSPQVWASRPRRALALERDVDLLLSIFPFEREWYARRVPNFRVEFVGHPLIDRFADFHPTAPRRPFSQLAHRPPSDTLPLVLLLPGSRQGELRRHLPVMLEAAQLIAVRSPARFRMILPSEELRQRARRFDLSSVPSLEVQTSGLPESLAQAELALASTGTVTMECAYFGVPTVAIYKTSWSTYGIGKSIIQVKYLAMPNLLANAPVFPEFIQGAARPHRIARAALDLLDNEERRNEVKAKLAQVIHSLGGPGAARRAAQAILRLPGAANGEISVKSKLTPIPFSPGF